MINDSREATTHRRRLKAVRAVALALTIACGPQSRSETDSPPSDSTSDSTIVERASHAERGRTTRGSTEHDEAESGNRVTLTEAAYQTAQIQLEPVASERSVAAGEALEVPGQVEFDPRRVALISPRVGGRIERLTVVDGDRVRAGQTVALLYSPAYLTAQNDYLQATRRAKLLAGTADAPGADALAQAATRRLTLMGASDTEIRRLAETGEPSSFLALTAPFAGSIMETPALPGAAIEAGAAIFKIADLSVVDVVADVPERALPLVRVGQGATIRLAAYPTTRFAGRVERLHDELDPETRTVHAVIHVTNSTHTLRPGMFASVILEVPVHSTTSESGDAVLTIPETALVTDGESRYVFVQVAPRTFERREVKVASLAPAGSAASTSGRVAVREGLAPGERVVVRGAFTLKSELAKAAFAEDEH